MFLYFLLFKPNSSCRVWWCETCLLWELPRKHLKIFTVWYKKHTISKHFL